MNVEFSIRAVRDLRDIATESRRQFGATVAAGFEQRFRDVIAHIAAAPEAAPVVEQRPNIRVVPLVRYPFKIFYLLVNDRVRILHIRHTSRRPWLE